MTETFRTWNNLENMPRNFNQEGRETKQTNKKSITSVDMPAIVCPSPPPSLHYLSIFQSVRFVCLAFDSSVGRFVSLSLRTINATESQHQVSCRVRPLTVSICLYVNLSDCLPVSQSVHPRNTSG